MHKKKYSFSALITVVILAVAVAISVTMMVAMRHFNSQVNAVTKKRALYTHIADVDAKVRNYYGGALDENQLQSALAEGYVKGIGDKYAKYYTHDQYTRALQARAGQAFGSGITVKDGKTGELLVDTVDNESAAHKAGVQAGDILVSINGESLVGVARQIVQNTLDTATDKIKLSVSREDKTLAFEITSYTYALQTVVDRMIGDATGYIRITAFHDNTASQFKAAYSALQNDGATAFVLDVRNCTGGGSTQALQEILSYVMPHGAYATYKGADGTVTNLVSHSSVESTVPTVVLANGNTCGEAEIFAGVLQEFGRATVIGEKTVGKGKVQDFVPLQADNSAMWLTVGEISLIRGGAIEGVGITPNTVTPMSAYKTERIGKIEDKDDDQLQAALKVFDTNVAATVGTTTTGNPVNVTSATDTSTTKAK
ncbi:MAG: PDZ domain-containing protein [Clostridia bacterium]|nr:PDZ domain-containing protein [Clostridia bacterium]